MKLIDNKIRELFLKIEPRGKELKQSREKALDFVEKNGFPTTKTEEWRFTDISQILKEDYTTEKGNQKIDKKDIEKFFTKENGYKIVFVDGSWSESLSEVASKEFTFSPLSKILSDDNLCQKYINQQTHKQDAFTNLNTALFTDGIYIEVPKGKIVEKNVEIVFISTEKQTSYLSQPRNVISLGQGAQLKVIESHHNLSQKHTLTNVVSEIFLDKDALLDYYKVQNDRQNASLIDNTFISQKQQSNASVHTFCLGGNILRNNLNFYHHGKYIESTLKGLTILNGKQHADHYTLVNHAQENCQSHQDYKYILMESSSGVFNGKIMVESIAQKTNAYQQNDTILLSEKASMNTKPQLEIFADDVKCSHGCTIGELNKDALFYLQTRGIPKKEAEALLTYAFANTVLSSVRVESLETLLSQIISKKLGVYLDI